MPRTAETPPDELDSLAKKLWRDTIRYLKEQGTWQESDIQALDRYVRACERARRAREALYQPDGTMQLTAVGSNGQIVQHPNVKTAREAERDSKDYAADLILSPASRQRLEITGQKPEGKFAAIF